MRGPDAVIAFCFVFLGLYMAGQGFWHNRRQMGRCERGRHHYTSITPDRVMCTDPGCGKRYGQ